MALMTMLDSSGHSQSIPCIDVSVIYQHEVDDLIITLLAGFVLSFSNILADWVLEALMMADTTADHAERVQKECEECEESDWKMRSPLIIASAQQSGMYGALLTNTLE